MNRILILTKLLTIYHLFRYSYNLYYLLIWKWNTMGLSYLNTLVLDVLSKISSKINNHILLHLVIVLVYLIPSSPMVSLNQMHCQLLKYRPSNILDPFMVRVVQLGFLVLLVFLVLWVVWIQDHMHFHMQRITH